MDATDGTLESGKAATVISAASPPLFTHTDTDLLPPPQHQPDAHTHTHTHTHTLWMPRHNTTASSERPAEFHTWANLLASLPLYVGRRHLCHPQGTHTVLLDGFHAGRAVPLGRGGRDKTGRPAGVGGQLCEVAHAGGWVGRRERSH